MMVDPLPILAALGISQPGRVTPIAGGWDTSLWRVEDSGRHAYALRVFRPEQAPTCRREALVMRALADLGLPVPKVHAENHEAPALLLDWCQGQPILEEVKARPWRIWRMGVAMGRVHARIHAVQVSEGLTKALPS